MSQLALPLQLADHAVFASFLAAGNETTVSTLREIASGAEGPGCWIWGAAGTGKTHLLQAVCDLAGDESVYVPLKMFVDSAPGILDGLASRPLVCLDDVQQVAGKPEWEQALFCLYNDVTDARGRIVAAARAAPRSVAIALPDLASRFSQLTTFHLRALGEVESRAALQLRAAHRGLDLPNETAQFLLNRSRRDMASLYDVLDRLDSEALRAQRRLTIPFVKSVLGS